MIIIEDSFYDGPERRIATKPRRHKSNRRHRLRTEALVSDCRNLPARRREDEEGLFDLVRLQASENNTLP